MKKEQAIAAACRQEESFRGLQYEANALAKELGVYKLPHRTSQGDAAPEKKHPPVRGKEGRDGDKRHGKKEKLLSAFRYLLLIYAAYNVFKRKHEQLPAANPSKQTGCADCSSVKPSNRGG